MDAISVGGIITTETTENSLMILFCSTLTRPSVASSMNCSLRQEGRVLLDRLHVVDGGAPFRHDLAGNPSSGDDSVEVNSSTRSIETMLSRTFEMMCSYCPIFLSRTLTASLLDLGQTSRRKSGAWTRSTLSPTPRSTRRGP